MEVWKQIANYPGYEVSNMGNIRSLKYRKPRILKYELIGRGYPSITLCKNGIKKQCTTHRIVAEHFIPNPENKDMCNHINGIKTDNRVENLEWSTVSENNYHAYAAGLKTKEGEHHHMAKLTDNDVLEIRILFRDTNLGNTAIGKMFMVNRQTIGDIRNRGAWSHVQLQDDQNYK